MVEGSKRFCGNCGAPVDAESVPSDCQNADCHSEGRFRRVVKCCYDNLCVGGDGVEDMVEGLGGGRGDGGGGRRGVDFTPSYSFLYFFLSFILSFTHSLFLSFFLSLILCLSSPHRPIPSRCRTHNSGRPLYLCGDCERSMHSHPALRGHDVRPVFAPGTRAPAERNFDDSVSVYRCGNGWG